MNKQSNTDEILSKIDSILKADIERLAALCSQASYLELSCFNYWLHLARAVGRQSAIEGHDEMTPSWLTASLADESLKYLIQCSAKYSSPKLLSRMNYSEMNLPLAQKLLKLANRINTKFNGRNSVAIFESAIEGERVRINYSKLASEPMAQGILDYFARREEDLEFTKMSQSNMNMDDLLDEFYKEHGGNDDLYKATFGVSLQTFVDLHTFLAEVAVRKLESYRAELPMISPDRVNVQDAKFYLFYTLSTYIVADQIEKKFGESINPVVDRLIFKPSNFNEFQLRYHLLARTPIISLPHGYLQVCPDYLLDSLFSNAHYSLLEGDLTVKEEYKKRSANKFVDRIAGICAKQGFAEIGRNIPLLDGKRDLGDIDLLVRNSANELLLIEAKNHALPLDVFFSDAPAAMKHLDYLKNNWERPLHRRIQFLTEHPIDNESKSSFQYMSVSRSPEIISHFSDHLFLGIYEFEKWLPNRKQWKTFSEVFRNLYENSKKPVSQRDLQEYRDAGFIL